MKNLFIRGPIRIGKSTALRNFANANYNNIIGLSSQRILTKDHQIVGYQAEFVNNTPIPSVDILESNSLQDVFIANGVANENALENIIKKIENALEKNNYDLIILDEIGGFELLNPTIFSLLQNILNTPIPCVGTLKQYNHAPKPNNPTFRKPYWPEYQLFESIITAQGNVLDVTSDTLSEIPLSLQLLSPNFPD